MKNMSQDNTRLEISRYLAIPRTRIWEAWANPVHLAQWWCPKPWTTEVRAFDFRPGGDFHTFMRGPDGGTSDNPGCFLEIVQFERIVWTSTLTGGWRPTTPSLPLTAVFSLADEGNGTRYTAACLHKDPDGCRKHEEMGFLEGWGTCITQLEAYAQKL